MNQHGYLPNTGTDTANLQLLNKVETAWDEQKPLYLWMLLGHEGFRLIFQAADSSCWQRLGVPLEILQFQNA